MGRYRESLSLLHKFGGKQRGIHNAYENYESIESVHSCQLSSSIKRKFLVNLPSLYIVFIDRHGLIYVKLQNITRLIVLFLFYLEKICNP